jgi:hypothetical protein
MSREQTRAPSICYTCCCVPSLPFLCACTNQQEIQRKSTVPINAVRLFSMRLCGPFISARAFFLQPTTPVKFRPRRVLLSSSRPKAVNRVLQREERRASLGPVKGRKDRCFCFHCRALPSNRLFTLHLHQLLPQANKIRSALNKEGTQDVQSLLYLPLTAIPRFREHGVNAHHGSRIYLLAGCNSRRAT